MFGVGWGFEPSAFPPPPVPLPVPPPPATTVCVGIDCEDEVSTMWTPWESTKLPVVDGATNCPEELYHPAPFDPLR